MNMSPAARREYDALIERIRAHEAEQDRKLAFADTARVLLREALPELHRLSGYMLDDYLDLDEIEDLIARMEQALGPESAALARAEARGGTP